MVQAGFEPATPASLVYIRLYKHHALPTTLLDQGESRRCLLQRE